MITPLDDVSPLLQTWQIIEGRGIGRGRRHEITPSGLTIGRSAHADITVLSTTVNEHHATIEWDNMREFYFIRDLNTHNGTFINQQPLRGTTKRIEQGNSLRFGYDTEQVFRVDVLKGKVPDLHINTTSTTTQTSDERGRFDNQPEGVTNLTVSTLPSIVSPMSCVPIINQPQTVVIPLSTNVSPVHQTGMIMATTVPTVPIAAMVPIATVSQIITTQSTVSTINTSSSLTPTITNTQAKTSAATETISDIQKEFLRVRIDGRRSVSSSNVGSPLYGVPSWWGEEGSNGEEETERVRQRKKVSKRAPILDEANNMPFSDSELIPGRIGSKILRDIENYSPRRTRKTETSSHRQDDTDLGPRSGSLSQGDDSDYQEHLLIQHTESESQLLDKGSTTFVINFGEESQKIKKPPSFISKRLASYTSGLSKVEESSHTHENVSTVTPQRKPNRGRTNSGKTSVRLAKRSVRKPPSGTKVTLPKAASSPAIIKKEETFLVSESDDSLQHQTQNVIIVPQIKDIVASLHSQSEILPPMKAHSQPNSLQGTPYAMSEPSGSRPGSARKQWTVSNEIPYSLIMASVETRMRRLSENAQNTVQNVRHVVDNAKREGLAFDGQGMTSVSINTELPLWKLVNKEYQHISKYIVEVEKSLKDINRLVGTGKHDDTEQVDWNNDDEHSSKEYLLVDSIEEEEISEIIEEESEGESDCEEEEAIKIERNKDYYEYGAVRMNENQDYDGHENEANKNETEANENKTDGNPDCDENEAITIESNLDYDGDDDSDSDEYFSASSDPDD